MKKSYAGSCALLTSFPIQASVLTFDQKLDQLLQPVAELFTSIIFWLCYIILLSLFFIFAKGLYNKLSSDFLVDFSKDIKNL